MRAALLAAAVAGCLAVTAGCTTTSADPEETFHADDNPTVRPRVQDADPTGVLFIGDSLTNGANLYGDLQELLGDAGFDDITVVALDGRDTDWGIRQIRRRESVPPVVVVELGTNPDEQTDGYDVAVSTMVEELRLRGAEEIEWVTPVHGRDDRYQGKVDILRSTPGIDVVDWASVVHANPSRLAVDGLHPTEQGYRVLAEFLTNAAVTAANR